MLRTEHLWHTYSFELYHQLPTYAPSFEIFVFMSYSSKQVFASEAAALFLENFREALLDSPSHPPGDQSSSNNESLDKHQRDCPVQLPSLEATSSGQSLASEEAPQQHL